MIDAFDFARLAHGRQKRHWSGEPYWRHPQRVALAVHGMLSEFKGFVIPWDHPAVTAAALHDVLEDTDVSEAALRELFGIQVAKLVNCVSHRNGESYPDYIDRIRLYGRFAATIKLCDLRDNLRSLPSPEENDKLEQKLRPRYTAAEAILVAELGERTTYE